MKKFAILIAALSLVLVGCNGDDDKADSNGKGTDTSVAGVELTKDNFAKTISQAQIEAGGADFTMDMDAMGVKIKGNGSVETAESIDDLKMKAVMDVGQGKSETRMVDGLMYVSQDSKTWMKIDPKKAGQGTGSVDQFDPNAQLDQFGKAMKSLDKDGKPVKLDGVEAQPYKLVLDGTKLVGDAVGEAGADQVPEEVTVVMWVGPDNLVRRIKTDLNGAKMSMDYKNWGTDVDVEAPPADSIKDMSEMPGMPNAS